MLRKISIRISQAVLCFLLISLIFLQTMDITPDQMAAKMIGSAFEHADEQSKQDLLSMLETNCKHIDGAKESNAQLRELCEDEQKRSEQQKQCRENYDEASKEVQESCDVILDIEDHCENLDEIESLDLEEIKSVCEQYEQGSLSEKDFVSALSLQFAGSMPFSIPKIPILIIVQLATFLFVVHFILHFKSEESLLKSYAKISFNLGLSLAVLLAVLIIGMQVLQPDSSVVLNSMLDESVNPADAMSNLLMLLPFVFFSFIQPIHYTLAIVFIFLGVILRWMSSKKK